MKYIQDYKTLADYKSHVSADTLSFHNVSRINESDIFFDPTDTYLFNSQEENKPVKFSATTANVVVNFDKLKTLTNKEVVKTTNKITETQPVTFDANSETTAVTRQGMFNLHDIDVNWSILQGANIPLAPSSEFVAGDILYTDGTDYYKETDGTLTAIGICMISTNQISSSPKARFMALESFNGYAYYNGNNTSIDFTLTDSLSSTTYYNGKTNTQEIAKYASIGNRYTGKLSGYTKCAAYECMQYSTVGTQPGDWYLASYAEARESNNNWDAIKNALDKVDNNIKLYFNGIWMMNSGFRYKNYFHRYCLNNVMGAAYEVSLNSLNDYYPYLQI